MAPGGQIDPHHLAGAELPGAFGLDLLGGGDAGLGGDEDHVGGQRPPGGRSPLRSRPAITCLPSEAAMAAGPSHGSVRKAWYS